MKKILYIIILIFVLISFVACKEETDAVSTHDESLEEKSISDYNNNEIGREVEEKDSKVNLYNELDSSKNLLLKFLHDEVPIVNYPEEGDMKYYSDISDENISLEDSKFYIVDMDGDGINEFGYYRYPMLDIIKYDQEDDTFELCISVKSQQRPIGEGEMYAIITSQPIIYEYYLYDEDANLVERDYYRTGEVIDKDNKTVIVIYEINGENVSLEEWNNETEYFFARKEAAPSPLTYQELFE